MTQKARDVNLMHKTNLSQHSWLTAGPEGIPTCTISACFALSHARSHSWKQEGLISPGFHSSSGGLHAGVLNSRDVTSIFFVYFYFIFSGEGHLFVESCKKSVVPVKICDEL